MLQRKLPRYIHTYLQILLCDAINVKQTNSRISPRMVFDNKNNHITSLEWRDARVWKWMWGLTSNNGALHNHAAACLTTWHDIVISSGTLFFVDWHILLCARHLYSYTCRFVGWRVFESDISSATCNCRGLMRSDCLFALQCVCSIQSCRSQPPILIYEYSMICFLFAVVVVGALKNNNRPIYLYLNRL